VPYSSEDLTWLLTEWQATTAAGGEYMTWRGLVGRYPGKSDLKWFWGLIAMAVEQGLLAHVAGDDAMPQPDARIDWERWELTDQGRARLSGAAPTG
jgi:hypothetical protein